MIYLLTTIHVLVCLFLILVVLLQSGKAADLAGAFGGMGSQTAFGPRGAATLLSKLTTGAAATFMVTSIALSIMATNRGGGGATTVLEGQAPAASGAPKQPATPATPPPADPKQGPMITIHPEGRPEEGIAVPLPVPGAAKDAQKGAPKAAPKPGEAKAPEPAKK